ncbi:flagellar biosynthetic protein FliR [Halolactibacillus alkaliphilus]|uniref:Flagellar biosynthetic protein FliR n=1 Tax=Halolactibacillus alkaliphilus TaxID=442899 RepID=A0A511WYQ9_9BACI|nr:flagellar biosynthetic protein FliR [Halolactibacillus alkaliphilus]GEN55793.1 flagellar biosynthetic protein FliR [Halolactibacillus alkaliphilus]GGN64924.1 flagellar biosynthetic protein FliR [Halolactibacillus alkaliphilus]SFO64696.1 flagellar biosynthetic protein FliR [Halolactibacillus alkaliphilus]
MLEIIELNWVTVFLLVFGRFIGFFVTLPIFSYRNIPTPFKIGLAGFISVMIMFTIDIPDINLDLFFVVLLVKEVIIGLLIGFVANIIMTVIQIAGNFIDFQMGFAIANVIDPQTGAQGPVIGQYLYIFALMFLLAVDGHHLLIQGAIYSFDLISVEQLINLGQDRLLITAVSMFNHLFLIAFQMAIPIVGTLFLVDVTMGIIARTVPQLNVFVVGIPLKIGVSLFVLSMFMMLYIDLVKRLFAYLLEMMQIIMRLLGG